MPIFATTFDVGYHTPIPVPYAAARSAGVRLLHDHAAHIHLDPFITSCHLVDVEQHGGTAHEPLPSTAQNAAVGNRAHEPWAGRTAPAEGGDGDGDGKAESKPEAAAISAWLRDEGGKLAAETGVGRLEYWQIAIPHPLGRWMGELKYFAAFVRVDDGVRVIVEVPGSFGMRSWNSWTVEEGEDSGVGKTAAYVERGKIECMKGFDGTVKKEHAKGHEKSHGAFVEAMVNNARRA